MDFRLLFALSLASFVTLVSGTHFAYGTYQWDCNTNTTTPAASATRIYRFEIELAFRRSFNWPAPPAGSSKPPNVGDTINVGSTLNFYPMGNFGGSAAQTFGIFLVDQINYLNDDWYSGTQTVTLQLTTYLNSNWRHYYSDCCRLSSIRDTNNNAPWTLTGVINRHSLYSPRVTGLPRIWFSLMVPNLYQIPVVLPLPSMSVTFRYANVHESTLNYPRPQQWLGPPVPPSVVTTTNYNSQPFQLNSITGECTWTPQYTGLYALGFIIEENCAAWQGTSCAAAGLTATPTVPWNSLTAAGTTTDNCCSRVPFDFIFQVVPDCNITIAQTGCPTPPCCAVPPYFFEPFALSVPVPWRQWNFTRGIQGTFMVCAKDDDKSQTTILIDNSLFPDNSLWVLDFQANPTCYFYSWTPSLTDVDQVICFYATAIPNQAKSVGQYCIKLHILPGNCIQLSGVIRDFHWYHPNFNKSYSDSAWNGTADFVSTALSSQWMPVFSAGAGALAPIYVKGTGLGSNPNSLAISNASPQGFYDWYNTDNPASLEVANPGHPAGPRNLATAKNELFCSGVVANNANIFTFLQSAFFPIDNQLFGNEGDDHNYFFTYEINTYLQYISGQVFNLNSDDDLWVFIDGYLPTSAPPAGQGSPPGGGWNLYGIKPDDTTVSPPIAHGYSINLDTFVSVDRPSMKLNETYRCDIFYANRMHRFPYLRIDLLNTTLCDALSVANYLFNFNTIPANQNSFYLTQSASNPAVVTTATIDGVANTGVIQLTNANTATPDSFAAVWYGNTTTPLKVKASHGFVAQFSVQISNIKGNAAEGFAFVLAQQLPQGASGPNLGYAQNANNFAVEFDTAQSASMSDITVSPNQTTSGKYSEIAFHYVARPAPGFTTGPPFDVNSAVESGASSGLVAGAYNNDPTQFLQMQNGTLHTYRIEYQPGQSNFSDPLNPVYAPGWMRVFVSTQFGVQLAPLTEFQLNGLDMANLLTGSCYMGITAGMSSQTGVANIYIRDWNFKFVPTDPASSTYTINAVNIIAGNTACVQIQAKDACGNLITVGGEGSSFNASFTPQFCTMQRVPLTPIDNNNGSYTFCYNPVIQGLYQMEFLFMGIPVNGGLIQRFNVIHAPAVPSNTFATFGELPNCFNTPTYCVGPTTGLFVARFNYQGHLVGNTPGTFGKIYDLSNSNPALYDTTQAYDGGLTAFQQFMSTVQATDYVALATAGDFNTATMQANMRTAAGSVLPAPVQMKLFTMGDTFAFVGSAKTPLINASCTNTFFCESRTQNGTAIVWARGSDTSSSSFPTGRNFTINAQSASQSCGPYARVMGVSDQIRLPAGSTNYFSIVAMDQFGNLCPDAYAALSAPAWNPDFTQASGNRPGGTLTYNAGNSVDGYYQYQFLSYQAGKYQVNIYLGGQNINGSYYNVVIVPGLANVTTSSGFGPALTVTTAGSNAPFTLLLADKVNNSINFNNSADNITGVVYQLDQNNNTILAIPVTLQWVNDPVAGCQACLLQASYNATVASNPPYVHYVMNFTMNGQTATYAYPNVVPGPLWPPSCTITLGGLAPLNPAGTPLLFTIQAADRYGNNRTIPNFAGDTFQVMSNVSQNNGFSVAYAGSGGIYNVQFKPQIKGPMLVNVTVTSTGQDPDLPANTYNVGTKVIDIIPGPADPYWSYVEYVPSQKVVAGLWFRYNIISFDAYGNFRNNQPFGPVATSTDYVTRSYIPPAGDAQTVQIDPTVSPVFSASGNYTIETNATVAGNYTLQVQTGLQSVISADVDGHLNTVMAASDAAAARKTPYSSVLVVPAPTWGPKTLYQGPGVYGGLQNSQTWFLLTAFDLFGNQEIDYHDGPTSVLQDPMFNPSGKVLYAVQVTGTCVANSISLCTGWTPAGVTAGYYLPASTVTISNGPTPGTYNVTYNVPANTKGQGSPWTDYNITISHTGGSVTSPPSPYPVGPWSVTLKASSNYNITSSCAIINVTNGTAGTTEWWNITDLSCLDSTVQIYSTPSFLVTVTSTDPATLGQTINPVAVSCALSNCGQVGVDNYMFNANFLPTVLIGHFRVRVYAWGYIETKQSSTNPGVLVTIGPGPVYPPACSVVGFNGMVQAGTPFGFTVALADQWYHPIGAGYQVSATATGPKGQVVQLLNGTWSGTNNNYTFTTGSLLTVAGMWNIVILEGTSANMVGVAPQIGGLFLQLQVTPGRIAAATTYAVFPPSTLLVTSSKVPFAVAGQNGFFKIYPEDQYGNSLPFPDAFAYPTTLASIQFADNVVPTNGNGPSVFTPTIAADPADPNNMIISVEYNATKIMTITPPAPNNIITVKVNDTGSWNNIAGTNQGADPAGPYDVLITPAQISASLSSISPKVPPNITAGTPLSFTLNAVDIYGNAWLSNQQDNLQALFAIPGSAGTGTTQQASVTALGNGQYQFSLDGSTTQQASAWNGAAYIPDYNVSLAYVNGAASQQLSGTAPNQLNIPSFTVVAGPTDPLMTVMVTGEPYAIIAAQWATYTVITEDQFGNRRWLGNDDLVNFLFYQSQLDCSGDGLAPVDETANFTFNPQSGVPIGQGAYNVTFTGKYAGLYTINVTVVPGGLGTSPGTLGSLDCIQTSKLLQTVLPGDPYPPKCWYTINPCDQIPAGGSLTFFLQINDQFGNAIMRTGTQWAVGFYNVPGAQALVGYSLSTPLNSANAYASQVDTLTTLPSGWNMPQSVLDLGTTPYDGTIQKSPPQAIFNLVKDFGNSSYAYTVQVFKAGPAGILISAVNGTQTWVVIPPPTCFAPNTNPSSSTVMVIPGSPRQFAPTVPQIFTTTPTPNSFTAAIPNTFVLQAMDYYGNNVSTNTHYYQIVIKDISNQNGYTVNVDTTNIGNGQTQVYIESAWHGNFSFSITLYPNSTIPGADNSAVSPPAQVVTIQHATCAFFDYTKPFRCPNRVCVAQYSQCTNPSVDSCTGSQVYCGTSSSSSCQASPAACPCPTGQARCGDGHCATTCPPKPVCLTDQVTCPSGECRLTASDCPSPIVCPPGYVTCYDGTSCARNLSVCPTYPACASNYYQCATGECVLALDDCPTQTTCPAGQVVCGTDGSCQADRTKCPDQYDCYGTPSAPISVRCGGTGECVADPSQCPPTVTCLPTFVKCPNGQCASTFSSCETTLACNYSRVRCPDGSCEHNTLFCGSLPTCPPTNPILCWDESCVTFGSECTYPQQCPVSGITCPGGACAAVFSQCPTQTRCPSDHPVLCSDGSCQNTSAACPQLPICPIQTPVRCPDGQSCRAQLSDCPSLVTCLPNQVKCSDGTCAVASDKCAPVALCPTGTLRCAGGECVPNATGYALCPTHVTCPSGYAKCSDGSCHVSCPLTYASCPLGTVTCPQASAGTQCAPDLSSCPLAFICPAPTVVRCTDSTCAVTAGDCPAPPPDSAYVTNKVPCPDGTYAADINSCPTPVTCPSQTPYKCYDGTCRIELADCPIPTPCPSITGQPPQYKCSNGGCYNYPWDCTSSATPCPASSPFQCAPTSTQCQANTQACCFPTADACNSLPNPISNCSYTSTCTIFCPQGYYYCADGSCKRSQLDCAPLQCPPSLPVMCSDGLCTDVLAHCNAANGCPYNKPDKCTNGACAANDAACSVLMQGQPTCVSMGFSVTCLDGSCASDSSLCPGVDGCPKLDTRCFDGTCALNCTDPSVGSQPNSDLVNVCPQSYPFRCPDGFCSKSLAACPYPLVNANCTGATPFQCAIGSCVVSSVQCPPVYPCPTTAPTRCGDGSCRVVTSSHTCPLADTCPTGSTRCTGAGLGSGLCTTDQSLCNISTLTGCPSTLVKCTQTGQCATSQSSCSTLPPSTGCPSGLYKCSQSDGSCAANQQACPLPNGCNQTASIRCAYGQCEANPSACPGQVPNTVPCADGSWAPAPGNTCPGLNGCPATTPFRCSNGQCAKFSALVPVSLGGCPLTVACQQGQVLCADGSCQTSTSQCPSTAPCTGTTTLCNTTFKCTQPSACPNAANVTYCPSATAPLLCPDGTCASNLAQCLANAGGPINQDCPSPKVRCIDESCVAFCSDCIQQTLNRAGTQQLQAACPGMVMCADGSCRPDATYCGIIPRCPLGQYRCQDGSCQKPANPTNPTINPCTQQPVCVNGYTRCEDGTCRKVDCTAEGCTSECLQYDGCGLQYPYACPLNRECSFTSKDCAIAALGNPSLKANERRLLQNALITQPCLPTLSTYGFCMAEVKAALTTITVDTTQSSTVAIALDQHNIPRLSLKFSSGSFVLKDNSTLTNFEVRPVGESRMRYAVNEIHASRRIQFGSFLPFSTTVLTPAFECKVAQNVNEPFNINVSVIAYFDQRPGIVNESDICLARLVELPGFTTWRCLFPSPADRGVDGPYYVKKDPTLPLGQVESVISFCTPQASAQTGVQSTSDSTAYAFIWSPLPNQVSPPAGPDVIQRNIVWIILGVLLGIAGLVLLTYCAFRLYRYRNKYKEQKEEADRLQEEVENMRQFGGEAGNKDDQVNMTANPLAVQLKDVQAKFNEEDIKLQQAEQDLRKQEGEIRQEHIKNMRENRDQLASQLEKLKRQLAETQAANQPKATYEEDNQGGTSYATDEPVREEFDGGQTSGAQPRRQKRDL